VTSNKDDAIAMTKGREAAFDSLEEERDAWKDRFDVLADGVCEKHFGHKNYTDAEGREVIDALLAGFW